MQESIDIDEIITQHAVFKLMENEIIPCPCGAYRKVIQNKKSAALLTQCKKCSSQEPFNIVDLTFIVAAFLKFAIADDNKTEINPPNVTIEEILQMIEDIQQHEAWVKEIEERDFRKQFKVLKGGLSKQLNR